MTERNQDGFEQQRERVRRRVKESIQFVVFVRGTDLDEINNRKRVPLNRSDESSDSR
ncbi:hypothetical protein RUM43_015029, partial [Polyplax serrata]